MVAGDHCKIVQREHYHLKRIQLDFGKALHRPDVQKSLRKLVAEPDNPTLDRRFRDSLTATVETPTGQRRASAPLARTYDAVISGAGLVQVGDGSTTKTKSEYVVHTTALPGAELLADSKVLRAQFVAAIREGPNMPAMDRFLDSALRAAGQTEALDLLANMSDLPKRRTMLASLFGDYGIEDAESVMIGSHNELKTQLRVHTGRFGEGNAPNIIAELHQEMAPTVAAERAAAVEAFDPPTAQHQRYPLTQQRPVMANASAPTKKILFVAPANATDERPTIAEREKGVPGVGKPRRSKWVME